MNNIPRKHRNKLVRKGLAARPKETPPEPQVFNFHNMKKADMKILKRKGFVFHGFKCTVAKGWKVEATPVNPSFKRVKIVSPKGKTIATGCQGTFWSSYLFGDF